MSYQFSDELIGQIAKSLQIALLTGTDIIDHLRQVYVEPDENGKLVLTSEFHEMFEQHLESMLNQIEEWQTLKELGLDMPSGNGNETVEN